MPKVNQPFPDFTLETYFPADKTTRTITLNEFSGKWLVVFFYPADFTFVCPTELHDLAKRYAEFQKHNAEIVAVSTDTVFTHKAWRDTEELLQDVQYPMGADHAGDLAKALHIFNAASGIADRGVYIVDPKGNLGAYQVVSDSIGRAASEILRQLKALIHVYDNPGIACPASWDEGQKDLRPDLNISGKVGQALRT